MADLLCEFGRRVCVLPRVEQHEPAPMGAIARSEPNAAHETRLGLRRWDHEFFKELLCSAARAVSISTVVSNPCIVLSP